MQTSAYPRDDVKYVRISNCQLLNNKGSGVAMDPPAFQNVVDNCTISGNNSGSDDDKKIGAALSLFSDADGGMDENKILNNKVIGNIYRGISLVAKNGFKTQDNAVCNNTVENNKMEGITDANSEDNWYIANIIRNNGGKEVAGRVTTGSLIYYDQELTKTFTNPSNSSIKIHEDPSPMATSPECKIPSIIQTIPPSPPKPTSDLGPNTKKEQ
jgi:hypothetical protein